MKIRYDPDADAMYIRFGSSEINHTKEIDKNTLLDFDSKGNVVGVEILFVKKRKPELLSEFGVKEVLPY